ncbi:MAG: response regulator [Magnetococcales bacterium]|nr:response regulator [Magnetococcales bacterium]
MGKKSKKPSVLIVDDVPENLDILINTLKGEYTVRLAKNGKLALKLAKAEPQPDIILLDIMMQVMDGYEVCQQLKADSSTELIPVVFVTAMTAVKDISKGLGLGAHYYLTKPIDPQNLLAVVSSVLEKQKHLHELKENSNKTIDTFRLIHSGLFHFKTLEEARNLAMLLAKTCPFPDRCYGGLKELMLNAVEHGNLGITYSQKDGMDVAALEEEVSRRLALSKYANKTASILIERSDKEIRFLISDQGDGFDWQIFMEFDPARIFDTHGRGIAMANSAFFDRVEYRGNGSEVLAVINIEPIESL